MYISSSYSKILGETNFHAREIPRSGSKAKNGEKKKKKKEEEKKKKKKKKKMPSLLRSPPRVDEKVGENNGQLPFVRHHVWRTQAHLDQLLVFVNVCHIYMIIYIHTLISI